MRNFFEYEYLGNGRVGFSVPGFVNGGDHYAAFVNSRPVLRVSVVTSDAAWLMVTYTYPLGAYTRPVSYQQTFPAANGSVVYIPVDHFARAAMLRPRTQSANFASPHSECAVSLQVSDGDFNALASASFSVWFYDGIGELEERSSSVDVGSVVLPMPDMLRCALWGLGGQGRLQNYMTVPPVAVGREPYSGVTVYRDTSTPLRYSSWPNDGGGLTVKIPSSPRATRIDAEYIRAGNSTVYGSTRIVWEDCGADKVLLVWWSPEFGGWKTSVFDVAGHADTVSARRNYTSGFDQLAGVDSSIGLRLRLPGLTARDYTYFRDVMFSDEVYRVEDLRIDGGDSGSVTWLPVRVTGSVPEWSVVGQKSLEITILTNELGQL